MGRVLVTGAAGFVGSAVCREALRGGEVVFGLVRPGELVAPVIGVQYIESDWADSTHLRSGVEQAFPDRIVHCAGATPRFSSDPGVLYEANVALCWRLLSIVSEGAPHAGVVLLSSAAVYDPHSPSPLTEATSCRPTGHYGWSKLLAEDVGRAFAHAQGLRVSIARPFNLLGVGESGGSVVSDVMAQLDAGADQIHVREIASTRDFIDVEDAAAAFLLLAESGQAGDVYNVCSNEGVTIAELVDAMRRTWGSEAPVVPANPDAVGTVSVGSNKKLATLGWERQNSLSDSLERLQSSRSE